MLVELDKVADEILRLCGETSQPRLSMSQFDDLTLDQRRLFCGQQDVADWTSFKKLFVIHQGQHGFIWSGTPGRGGPLLLTRVELTEASGQAIGDLLHQERVEDGDLNVVLSERLPHVAKLLTLPGVETGRQDLRSGFKKAVKGNSSFHFFQGRGLQFKSTTREYRYQGRTRKHEDQLGEQILYRLKEHFKLARIEHIRSSRQGGRFENADIVGFRINRMMDHDDFVMFSFELKATNDIPAISQAINYRSRSNLTYIVIPLFDVDRFHDEERHKDLTAICRSNGIGAISVRVDPRTHVVLDIDLVEPAEFHSISKQEWLQDLVDRSHFERCVLCRRVVNVNIRERCGWQVEQDGENVLCMKVELEKSVVEQVSGSHGRR